MRSSFSNDGKCSEKALTNAAVSFAFFRPPERLKAGILTSKCFVLRSRRRGIKQRSFNKEVSPALVSVHRN